MDTVNKQTAKGLVWSVIDRFAGQGIQFLMSLVIARLVLPADYGLIAMLMVFMAIAQTFVDSGFGSALVQKKERTEVDFSTVFLFSCFILPQFRTYNNLLKDLQYPVKENNILKER